MEAMKVKTKKLTCFPIMFIMITGILVMLMFMVTNTCAYAASPVTFERVTGLKQTDSGKNSISVEWSYATNPDVNYLVQYSQDNKNWISCYEGSYNWDKIVKMNSGHVYYVRVCAFTKSYVSEQGYINNYGPWSQTVKCVTLPNNVVKNIKQIAETTTSVTVSWDALKNMTSYKVVYREVFGNATSEKTVITSANAICLKGLEKNKNYLVRVHPQIAGDTYTAVGSDDYIGVSVKPSKPTGLYADYWLYSLAQVSMSCKYIENANGYQWQLGEGNKVLTTITKSSNHDYHYYKIDNPQLRKYKFLKVRVRAYVNVNGDKKYGDWSNWTYIAPQPDVDFKMINKKGFGISWDQVSGANNYTVYISTKMKSGYKKVATTKNTSLTISKYGGSKLISGKTYYVYVVANKKVGRTTYKSIHTNFRSQVYKN